ncbi:MAG TPA: metallophosphoesterase [Chitinophagaceae bacterium]|nr:metallophosphoesterase [Chitinophagaceae bacterium]
MRFRRFSYVIIVILLLIDLYVFQAVKAVVYSSSHRTKFWVYLAYWLITVLGLLTLFLYPYLNTTSWPKTLRSVVFTIVLGLYAAKIITIFFLILDDIRRFFEWVIEKVMPGELPEAIKSSTISRSRFISKLGLLMGGTLFATLIYGFSNKYNYRIRRVRLSFDHLPAGFRGLKIVQISDIHSGSFDNKEKVNRGVTMAMDEKPDIIFFTGDLINNHAVEMDHYLDVFSRLRAPMGVWSTLGNHDYGDYTQWPSLEDKAKNLEKLKQLEAQMGWTMLNNAHTILERGGDRIALIGVENWSAKKYFTRYGDLKKAYAGTAAYPFKILLSHDPTHWDAQVRPEYPDIDLTLSGHTHGMQFGVDIPGFRWSPIQYVYKEWADLYREKAQYLYVNRGYGFIGYPGRVGVLPEITVIELT